MKNKLKLSLLSSTFLLSACSALVSNTPPPEVQTTLIQVAASYLTGIVINEKTAIGSFGSVNDILKHNNLTEEKFYTRIAALQNSFPGETHPLVKLIVISVTQDGNDATVTLQKENAEDAPQITVSLYWANSGWLVIDDSITGDEELIEQLTGI